MGLDLIQIAVCDDSKTELALLKKMLEYYDEMHRLYSLKVAFFSDGDQLMQALKSGERFDIFLLDVMMPTVDGITLGRQLREKMSGGEIIYITASEHYALEAFRVHAVNYLLKPLDHKELFSALDDVIGRLFVQTRYKEQFVMKTREGVRRMALDSITHVENAGRALRIFLIDGSVLESVVSQKTFDEQVEPLLRDPMFLRTHKSYVANMRYVRTLTDKELYIADDYAIPVSRRNYATVYDAFQYQTEAFRRIYQTMDGDGGGG